MVPSVDARPVARRRTRNSGRAFETALPVPVPEGQPDVLAPVFDRHRERNCRIPGVGSPWGGRSVCARARGPARPAEATNVAVSRSHGRLPPRCTARAFPPRGLPKIGARPDHVCTHDAYIPLGPIGAGGQVSHAAHTSGTHRSHRHRPERAHVNGHPQRRPPGGRARTGASLGGQRSAVLPQRGRWRCRRILGTRARRLVVAAVRDAHPRCGSVCRTGGR